MCDNKPILTPERVDDIFQYCLCVDDEEECPPCEVEAVTVHMRFDCGRIEEKVDEISLLLGQLPESFRKTGGGGDSFLNIYKDRNGIRWAGLQQQVERLVMLGLAAGKLYCQVNRSIWSSMPGGVPYYVILD